MDQVKSKPVPKKHDDQFLFEGRWVDKAHFRTFVYNHKDEQRLADSYKEYESLMASGLWFASKPEVVPQGKRKNKNGTIRADSE